VAVLVLLVHSGIKPGIVIDRGFLDGAFHFSAGDYLAGMFMDTVTDFGTYNSSVDGLRSFRLRAEPEEPTSVFHECKPGQRKLAVNVVDIFGNDTMTIVDVKIVGKNR